MKEEEAMRAAGGGEGGGHLIIVMVAGRQAGGAIRAEATALASRVLSAPSPHCTHRLLSCVSSSLPLMITPSLHLLLSQSGFITYVETDTLIALL